MPQTPNHDYNVPNEGDQDWHVPLNDNFEQFDTDVEIRDSEANRGGYDPKAGAKFLATDTGAVYLGDGSSWNHLASTGTSPRLTALNPGGQFLGVGRTDPVTGSDRFGVLADADAEVYGGMYVDTTGPDGWPFYGYATDGEPRAWHYYDHGNGEWHLVIPDASPRRVLTVDDDGNLSVSGNKNFVQSVDTDDGEREVVYTATEAGTPHTEASGVAELDGGRAVVSLPDHFGWVTSDEEPLHVQTTPYAAGSAGLAVVERSTDRIVVEDRDGEGDYEFSYTVKGTREGRADKQVVREPSAEGASPAPADD